MERLGEVTEELKHKLARLTAGRFLQARVKGNRGGDAVTFAQAQNWVDRSQIVNALKSAVGDIGTGDFPAALFPIAEAFVAAARPSSIPRRLEGLRRVPMRTRIYVNSQGVVVTAVPEHGPIPVLKSDWTVAALEPVKFAGIVVQTKELLDNISNVATLAVIDDLAKATAEAENLGFISPNETGSILAGAPNFAASGSAISDVDTDLRALVALVPGADQPGAAFVMRKTTATYLATLRGSGGAPAFPDLSPGQSGTLLKLPVLVSQACEFDDSPPTGFIGLLSPSEIFWADEGRAILTTSTNASLIMDDAPDDSPANVVSMFQADAVATKAVLESAWYSRAGAGAYFTCAY